MLDADVAVVGLGAMGSMATWQLARKGISVIGFEQFNIGHDLSASGGETRMFRTPHTRKTEYIKLFKDASKEWLELEKETGNKLMTINKALILGEENSDFITNTINGLNTMGVKFNIFNKTEAKKYYPQHCLLENEVIIEEDGGGFLRPEYAIVSAVQRAKELGAKIYSNTKVDKIKEYTDGVIINSNGKEFKVNKVLLTVGPWVNEYFDKEKAGLKVHKLFSTWFVPKKMELFTSDRFPVFIKKTDKYNFYGFPSIDESMVKISQRKINYDINYDINNPNRSVEKEEIIKISKVIKEFLPALNYEPIKATSSFDSFTIDYEPLIGKIPDKKNIYIMSGFSGHGFKLAAILGKVISEILIYGDTQYDITAFKSNRFEMIN